MSRASARRRLIAFTSPGGRPANKSGVMNADGDGRAGDHSGAFRLLKRADLGGRTICGQEAFTRALGEPAKWPYMCRGSARGAAGRAAQPCPEGSARAIPTTAPLFISQQFVSGQYIRIARIETSGVRNRRATNSHGERSHGRGGPRRGPADASHDGSWLAYVIASAARRLFVKDLRSGERARSM